MSERWSLVRRAAYKVEEIRRSLGPAHSHPHRGVPLPESPPSGSPHSPPRFPPGPARRYPLPLSFFFRRPPWGRLHTPPFPGQGFPRFSPRISPPPIVRYLAGERLVRLLSRTNKTGRYVPDRLSQVSPYTLPSFSTHIPISIYVSIPISIFLLHILSFYSTLYFFTYGLLSYGFLTVYYTVVSTVCSYTVYSGYGFILLRSTLQSSLRFTIL